MTVLDVNLNSIIARKSREELILLARTLGIPNVRAMKKAALVHAICSTDIKRLDKLIRPTWWSRYHNHVYGVAGLIGLVLSVAALQWPNRSSSNEAGVPSEATPADARQSAESIERPMRLRDFARLATSEKQHFLERNDGEPVVWEGFVLSGRGFIIGDLEAIPMEQPVGLLLSADKGNVLRTEVECDFGVLEGGDSDYELISKLNLIQTGQRVLVSGRLDSNSERPRLWETRLEAEWPRNE